MSEWVTVRPGNFSNSFSIKADDCWIRLNCTRGSAEMSNTQHHCIKSAGARELAMALLAAADRMDQLSNKGKEP